MAAGPQPGSQEVPVTGPDQPEAYAGGGAAEPGVTEPGLTEPGAVAPGTAVPGAGPGAPTAPVLPQHRLERTRLSGIWIAVAAFAIVLLLLLIFILENSKSVEISYFGAHGHLPLAIALLLEAIAGVLLIGLPGAARIVQLRIAAKRHRRADAGRVNPGRAHTGRGAHRGDGAGQQL